MRPVAPPRLTVYGLMKALATQAFLLDQLLELQVTMLRRMRSTIGPEEEQWLLQFEALRSQFRAEAGADLHMWLLVITRAEALGLFGNLADEQTERA